MINTAAARTNYHNYLPVLATGSSVPVTIELWAYIWNKIINLPQIYQIQQTKFIENSYFIFLLLFPNNVASGDQKRKRQRVRSLHAFTFIDIVTRWPNLSSNVNLKKCRKCRQSGCTPMVSPSPTTNPAHERAQKPLLMSFCPFFEAFF